MLSRSKADGSFTKQSSAIFHAISLDTTDKRADLYCR